MRKTIFALSLFSLLLCGCNNEEVKSGEEFKSDKPIVEETDSKEDIEAEEYTPLSADLNTFSFNIDNSELGKINQTFEHRQFTVIGDEETYRNFNVTFNSLLQVSNEKDNTEINLPIVDFAKQDIAVVTYHEENIKSSFATRISGVMGGDELILKTVVKYEEEGDYSSFGIFYAVLKKDKYHRVRENYVNFDDLRSTYTAGA